MRKIKGISYDTVKDKDVMNHIKEQPCEYKYVWDLVRKDMKEDDIETKIRREIERYIGSKSIVNFNRTDVVGQEFDDEEILNIKDILDGI